MSGSGTYLLAARIVLTGDEPIAWDDLDSIDVVGLSNWSVTPRTRCQLPGGTDEIFASIGVTRAQLCGANPIYENILDIDFSAETDAELPPASTGSFTIRLGHRREGWRSFTFTPTLASQVPAAGNVQTTVTTPTPAPRIDVTGVRP